MRYNLLGVASPLALVVALGAGSASAQSASASSDSVDRPILTATASAALAGSAAAQSASASSDSADKSTTVTEVVVTGIRASLVKSADIKRKGQGVVDAITAEDIGKFPDTNLAESLQRITGVSIDRSFGEGSKVTVRGFGPDFNLVLLNGRQMPASGIGDCCSAPASRSFDFANLASEGVAAVEVYKSGRVTLPTGGIGSVINILTPRPLDRPGFHGSFGFKSLYDTSRFTGSKLSPEVSGIISDTFLDGKVGILATGSYQRRRSSQSDFSAGWREGYLGNENNWESLATNPTDPRYAQITNHPKATDIYQVPQNAAYDFTDVDRKRLNGQLVLQFRPVENLTATVDYTYSQNTIDQRTSSIGFWFNGNNTTSSWTNGPTAAPNIYSEAFRQVEQKDFSYTGALAANRNINRSIGGNISWHGLGGLRLVLDAHHSTAQSMPTSPFGSNIAVGASIFGVQTETVDFTHYIPAISVSMYPGSELTAANIRPSGNAFRNALMRDQIEELSLKGGYDFDASFIKSLDFGVTYTDNQVRSAFGNIQNDTWGGTLSAADTPDSLFTQVALPPRLGGLDGSNAPGILQNYFSIKTADLIKLLNNQLGICTHPITGSPSVLPGGCLSTYTTDRRTQEQTLAPYLQSLHAFDLFGRPANLRLGLRYETTKVDSKALVPVPTGTEWTGDNEVSIIYGPNQSFQGLKGEYHNLLPAIDFDVDPITNVKLRASYSHTITRPDYASIQGGTTINGPIRVGGSTGNSGNPGLIPYKSKNIDLSAEWYYKRDSYVSVGYFHKDVSNFIKNNTFNSSEFGLTNPADPAGPEYKAAIAALGANATTSQIRTWIAANYPALVAPGATPGTTPDTYGAPDDPLVNFVITKPVNSSQKAALWGMEFAIQHSFWDTGFGTILNYTLVNSDTSYNNALSYHIPQFAVTGVSDSANAVLYYDKNGLQARVAYNWRDRFLSGYGTDPSYVEPYGQIDVSASYTFRNGLTAFFEGINVTDESRRVDMRASQIVAFAAPGYARYDVGLRYKF